MHNDSMEAAVRRRFAEVPGVWNERPRRLWAAAEAKSVGYGGVSMVARATDAGINKSVNDRLERTEFMPFAPSCLDEYADQVFAGVGKARHTAQFMTVTFDVHPDWRERVPAVVHVDGTARPQLVRSDRNRLYHALIERDRRISGIPLVLNTSFNVHEEPIVCGPREAVHALVRDRIDCLAIGPFWASPSASPTGQCPAGG